MIRGYHTAQVYRYIAKTSSCTCAQGERLNEYKVEDDYLRWGTQAWDIDIIIVKIIGFILPGGFIVFIKFKNN